jgi:uncharacterized protein YecE (DUF72 family)
MSARPRAPLRIGTSGWSYPGGRGSWNGVFYPAKEGRPRRFDELEFYARWFDVVEVNSTFYGQPRPKVTAGWAERTPTGFEFAVKLFQKFTHPSMFVEAVAKQAPGASDAALSAAADIRQADVDAFKAGVDPLAAAGKLGPLLVQFPASFTADAEGVDYLGWLLRAFGDYTLAVELRHKSWSDHGAETTALLAAHGAASVLIDEPKFRFSIRQNWVAPAGAAPGRLAYVRFHGRNAAEWWRHAATEDRYNYLYSEDELKPLGAAVKGLAGRGMKAYVFFNNHFSAQGVANAVQLRRQLGDPVPEPLPPALVEHFPWLDAK